MGRYLLQGHIHFFQFQLHLNLFNFIQIYFNFDVIEGKENRKREQRGLQKGTYLKDIYICKVQFHASLFQLHKKQFHL
jgi:hypothetical protein